MHSGLRLSTDRSLVMVHFHGDLGSSCGFFTFGGLTHEFFMFAVFSKNVLQSSLQSESFWHFFLNGCLSNVFLQFHESSNFW